MFFIQNLSASEAHPGVVWELCGQYSLPPFFSKDDYIAYVKKPDTKHCHYSLYEGLNPSLRVAEGGGNPIVVCHGFVADYDFKGKDVPLEVLQKSIAANCPAHLVPNFVSRTFSKGARLVWIFSEPLPIASTKILDAFLKKAVKTLKLSSLCAGFDEGAFLNPFTYFEIGHSWSQYALDPLDVNHARNIMFEAVKGLHRVSDGPRKGAAIPMDIIAGEVERQFPGQWFGDFSLNARGRRFWEAGADNPTATIVKEDGMLCFTGDRSFLSWSELLGASFVREWEEDRIVKACSEIYWDGDLYYKLNTRGQWESLTKVGIELYLTTGKGLAVEGASNSELKEALLYIHEVNRVDSIAPLVHFPPGLVHYEGTRYLNISRITPLQPAEVEYADPETDFPFLSRLLFQLFVTDDFTHEGGPGPELQFHTFLTWLQKTYQAALNQDPIIGQAIYIAGPAECGKSLVGRKVISPLLGGFTDAGRFLLGKESFSAQALSYPVMCVDDGEAASDQRTLATFTSNLKKLIVNKSHTFRDLFRRGVNTVWLGRIVITCNEDPESLRILPDASATTLDKVHLFKVQATAVKFPFNTEEVVAKELPFFARWLISSYTPPDEVLVANRYGHACYHHSFLLGVARDATPAGALSEVLRLFLDSYDGDVWTGSCAELLSQMTNNDQVKPLVDQFSVHSLGRTLSQMELGGFAIFQKHVRSEGILRRTWHLPKKVFGCKSLSKKG
jgi:hypothetical protein